MNQAAIHDALEAMLRESPGVRGCALVDVSSGLIWQRAGGRPEFEPLWEASVDYWRMHSRLRSHFESLGDLGAAVMYHRLGILALMPCPGEPDLLVVCIGENGRIDWNLWQQRIRELGGLLKSA